MDDERYIELNAKIHGLFQIVVMIIDSLPKEYDIENRLAFIEETMRKQNGHSGTIETLRQVRSLLP